MLGKRQEPQKYISDTFNYINTVKEFCSNFSQWKKTREMEMDLMKDIKEREGRLNIKISDAVGSKSKYTFGKYLKSKFQMNADSKPETLENELTEVLKNTVKGLEELQTFLDAVEKLAVTSLHVFTENQVLHLPENIDPNNVQAVIIAARQICHLLLVFKRDAEAFFLPKFQNVEVFEYMLEKYLKTTAKICDTLGKSFSSDVDLKMAVDTAAEFNEDLCEDDKQKMVNHIKKLDNIRMDEDFRMVFLSQEVSCSGFIKMFKARQTKMLKFLDKLEDHAVQLDRMNKGAKISRVTGKSVGAVGNVLTNVGLALSPVTAGVSLGLTIVGIGLGVISGVNSAATKAAKIGVNHKNQKKANEVFQNCMEDIQSIQDCLEEVTHQPAVNVKPSKTAIVVGVGKIAGKVHAVVKRANSLVKAAKDFLRHEQNVASAGRLASDVPDVGQVAVKAPLVLSSGARAGLFVANALFLGTDLFSFAKDGMGLAKGSETKISKLIRARAALWSSEIKSWEKIHDCLSKGLTTSEEKKAVLDMSFYPDIGMAR